MNHKRMINNNKNIYSKNNNNSNSNINSENTSIKSINKNENISSENNTNTNVIISSSTGDETSPETKEISSNTCPKCSKTFSSPQSLKLHLNTTECSSREVLTSDKNCEYCTKTFSSKQMLKYHLMVCSEKKIYNVIAEYENRIKDLEKIIEELSSKIESEDS